MSSLIKSNFFSAVRSCKHRRCLPFPAYKTRHDLGHILVRKLLVWGIECVSSSFLGTSSLSPCPKCLNGLAMLRCAYCLQAGNTP
jgi:hypothetical protein